MAEVFGIHPLTTEDILLEETREKIELFRNYYLVCFRSFDQDPYSQTYLEPLNMYIIVFREGTLSVRLFRLVCFNLIVLRSSTSGARPTRKTSDDG
jgi:Mg2+ and Co2+ transporter CorA